MRPGRLTHRVTVQENTTTRDQYGQLADSWDTVEVVYANVRPLRAAEVLSAGASTSKVSHIVTMRHRTDLGSGDTKMLARYRLSYDSRTFAVRGVIDIDERHRWLEVMAEEVAA